MDIRRLTHFIALAEEGRFAVAAERVHLSQAAFSRSIQALEQRMGLKLFDRGAKGASLTPAGEGVYRRTSDDEITVAKNGGGAHLDLMTAAYILAMWRQR